MWSLSQSPNPAIAMQILPQTIVVCKWMATWALQFANPWIDTLILSFNFNFWFYVQGQGQEYVFTESNPQSSSSRAGYKLTITLPFFLEAGGGVLLNSDIMKCLVSSDEISVKSLNHCFQCSTLSNMEGAKFHQPRDSSKCLVNIIRG